MHCMDIFRWLRLDHSSMVDKLGIIIIRLFMSLGVGCVLYCCKIGQFEWILVKATV